MSSNSISFAPPRGMRDFYPEDMADRNILFGSWRESACRFGFSEYDACVVESMELLRRKAGEEISEQIYTFKDKSDRDLALRPEMTPSLARMICARQGSLSLPIKWFTIAQCFRYERTTRGRKREHYQWNLDIVGDDSVSAEAEIIACAVDAMTALGIDRKAYRIHFSNRRLLADLLAVNNIPKSQHPTVFLALDKKGKVPDETISQILTENSIPGDTVALIDKLCAASSLEDIASIVPDSPALEETRSFMRTAAAYGIEDVLSFNLSVIRGLAYYTGIVFEAFDKDRSLRAIFGGGRYDGLLSSIGGPDITAVGLGFGDVVVQELINELGIKTDSGRAEGIAIGFMEADQQVPAVKIATAFRKAKRNVFLSSKPQKPKTFFGNAAANSNCTEAVYLGPDDLKSGTIRIKNLATREEKTVQMKEITG